MEQQTPDDRMELGRAVGTILELQRQIEGRFDRSETRLDRLEMRLDRFEARLDRFEENLGRPTGVLMIRSSKLRRCNTRSTGTRIASCIR